ncbi:hypothetical protein HBN74_01745 [Pseudomonas sp. WS 5019]|nr:hypothetical protein [Pseudomonas sp. WS 5019]NMY14282.1 hypothetical protein [Pseudomonas sp. WS 5019]
MSNIFDGYYVDVVRDGDAVDISIYLLVDRRGYENRYKVGRLLYWVVGGCLEETQSSFSSELDDDYVTKLCHVAYDVWEKIEKDYNPKEVEVEGEDEKESSSGVESTEYYYSYDRRIYSKKPKLRKKVLDKIVEENAECSF